MARSGRRATGPDTRSEWRGPAPQAMRLYTAEVETARVARGIVALVGYETAHRLLSEAADVVKAAGLAVAEFREGLGVPSEAA